MTMTHLTQREAIARAASVLLDRYELHLDLSEAADQTSFPVTSTIVLCLNSPDLFIDYLGAEVHSVTVNGNAHDFRFNGSRIELTNLPVGQELAVRIAGLSTYSRTGQGLHRMVDTADAAVYLYSHLEPSDARRIYPCLDQPDLKAPFVVSISAPDSWTILANQPEVSRETSAGTATVSFAPTPPLSTYLTSFAAGPYIGRHATWTHPETGQHINLGAWSRASMSDYLDAEILELTAQGLDFFHEQYRFDYPWGKYDSIFVPEYNLGAMENPGLVTFTESYLFRSQATRAQRATRANTILHEMAHMWFGDLVTPQWWDDLWLKESFAEFMGADASVAATEYREAWANFALSRKAWAYIQDQLPTTHPIKADIPDVYAARQNFDGITYAKGAAVLKQLVHYVGRAEFYAGARDYFRTHAFGAATFDDLLTALAQHTDRDLQSWANAWLMTTGMDTLRPQLSLSPDGTAVRELQVSAGTRPHRTTVSFYYRAGERLERRYSWNSDIPPGGSTITAAEGVPAPDLIVLNDGDHTYAKLAFDPTSLATLRAQLSGIDSELSRAIVWNALWNLARDGELLVTDYADIVLRHSLAESNPALLSSNLSNALFGLRFYHPQPRQQVAAYARQLFELLKNAEPGSDTQLTLARTVVAAAADNSQLEAIRQGAIPGLRLDPDLRWAVLRALAARDELSAADLAAARAQDNTLSGATEYLGASHSAPQAATKAEIFTKVTAVGEYSNAEVDSLLQAYQAGADDSLREGLSDRYFAEIVALWQAHPQEIAARLVRGLYPASEGTEARTDELLRGDLPGALRRELLECQDHLLRRRRNLAANSRS